MRSPGAAGSLTSISAPRMLLAMWAAPGRAAGRAALGAADPHGQAAGAALVAGERGEAGPRDGDDPRVGVALRIAVPAALAVEPVARAVGVVARALDRGAAERGDHVVAVRAVLGRVAEDDPLGQPEVGDRGPGRGEELQRGLGAVGGAAARRLVEADVVVARAVLVGRDRRSPARRAPRSGCPTGARPRCRRTPCRPRPAPAPPRDGRQRPCQRRDPALSSVSSARSIPGIREVARGLDAGSGARPAGAAGEAPGALDRGGEHLAAELGLGARPWRGQPRPRAARGGRRASCPAGRRPAPRPSRARAPTCAPGGDDLGDEAHRVRLGGLDRCAR